MTPTTRRRLYLRMYNKLRFPRSLATAVIKTLAFVLDPLPWWRRRQAAQQFLGKDDGLSVPSSLGYRKIEPEQLPYQEAAVADCRAVYREAQEKGKMAGDLSSAAKPFLISLNETCSDLFERPGVRNFVLSPQMMSIVCGYFGSVPVLTEVQLLWTPVNDSLIKSQQFHLDAENYRQLKLFMNIEPVDSDTGPFTFLPAEVSRRVCQATRYVGGRRTRLSDEAVFGVSGDTKIQVTGESGSGIFIDTSRCLHYGSRNNKRERLVLFVQFVSYYAPKLEAFGLRENFEPTTPLPELDRLLLNYRSPSKGGSSRHAAGLKMEASRRQS